MEDGQAIASALESAFVDEDREENVTDAINRLARAITNLGNADAATPMGGMEALGGAMKESADTIAASISELAAAIDRMTDAR